MYLAIVAGGHILVGLTIRSCFPGYKLGTIILISCLIHFLVSFIYHVIRARNYFLNYYTNLDSLSGYTLSDHQTQEVSPQSFSEELEEFRKDIVSVNNERMKTTPSKVEKTLQPKTRGVYGPECKVWEVARESVLFLGGGRAVFLQLAHPYVASGVEEHSKVAHDIQRRFYNTFYHVFHMTFGELDSAEKSAKQVRKIHDKVIGTLSSSPPYSEGAKYSANHEGAIIWVWATLVETSMMMFELIVRKMSLEEKELFYIDQKQFVRFFGVSPSVLPKSWNDFMIYTKKMWNGDPITVSDPARRAEVSLFRPKKFASQLLTWGARRLTFTLLPPRIAKGFNFKATNLDYAHVYILFALTRMIYSSLPGSLRYLTSYIEAQKRIAGYDVYNYYLSSFAASVGHWFMHSVILDPSQNKPK